MIKNALLSVSDKTGIVDFAKGLVELGITIYSTGGTLKAITDAGIAAKAVETLTGFPEMMDGRVKTLHPKVHGGILAIRDNGEHQKAMADHGIEPIDLVVVNLYPFRETIAKPNVSLEEAIENIDIGGPSMVRSAAKNHAYVGIVVNPNPVSYTHLEFNIPYEMVIASAHRTPEAVKDFVTRLEDEGAIAFIAGAGAAAHLPGVVASFTTLPVIGIPLNATALKGIDSLLAIVQMPSGMPVATMAVDGAKNGALFAVQIGAAFNKDLKEQYQQYRKNMADKVLADNAELQGAIKL